MTIYADFIKSRKKSTDLIKQFPELNDGIDVKLAGYVYFNSYYIIERKNDFYLVLGNHEYKNNVLTTLEHILWNNFVRDEMNS